MELLPYIVGFGGALFGIGGAVWHETKWLGRRSWTHADGRVIDIVRIESNHESNHHPKIEFTHEGSLHDFTSEYGGSGLPKVGSVVQVIYDPVTLKAERFSYGNRWIFTIGPAALGLFFLWIGIAAKISNAEQGAVGQSATAVSSKTE